MNTFFSFCVLLVKRIGHIFLHRKRQEKWAIQIIKDLEHKLGGTLDEFTFNKIVKSYAVYVLMICDAFTQLDGRNTDDKEKLCLLYYFICSSLFDNFCDRKELTNKQLFQISFSSESYSAVTISEKMFLHVHLFLLNKVQEKEAYLHVIHLLFQAQLDSDKQFSQLVTNEELELITKNKGGYSVLMSSFYLDKKYDAPERNCWYLLGYIIQLTNDLYDIYKDLQEGSETLPDRINDAYAFKTFFEDIVAELSKNIDEINVTGKRKKRFYFSMMNVCSFGAVALNQLCAIQTKHKGQLPALTTLERKELIVDMERFSNIRCAIRYSYQKLKEYQPM